MCLLGKGITLVALVITVIILLILAGITLGFVFGKNGIIGMAKNAGKNYVDAENEEGKTLNELYSSMMVATNEGSQITVNIEDLKKIIDQSVEQKVDARLEEKLDSKVEEKVNEALQGKNPKLILTVSLPGSNGTARAVGTYKASTSFTKVETENYNTYLKENEDKTWTVLKSGNYLIKNTCNCFWVSNLTSTWNNVLVNDQKIPINFAMARNDKMNYGANTNTSTLYLEEGTKLDFSNDLNESAAAYHSSSFFIYAMFE